MDIQYGGCAPMCRDRATVYRMMQRTATGVLISHAQWLEGDTATTVAYSERHILPRTEALELAWRALRLRAAMPLPEQLRLLAEHCDAPRAQEEWTNLAAWVGVHTPAWRAIMDLRAGGVSQPWFMHLDECGQRCLLLLAAEALESDAQACVALSGLAPDSCQQPQNVA